MVKKSLVVIIKWYKSLQFRSESGAKNSNLNHKVVQNLMFKLQKSLILIHNRCKISLLIYRHTINGVDLILSRQGSFLRAIFQFYYLETDFEITCNLEIKVSESKNEYYFTTPLFRAEKLNRCLFIYYQSYIFWKSLKLIFYILKKKKF